MNKKVLITFAALFVVALIGQFMFSIYSNLIDKSSYTDWISAFCNVVMAGATVGAVLIARNYLAQFTAQEGYKIAIDLVNNHLLSIKKLKSVETDYFKLHDYITSNPIFLPKKSHLSNMKTMIDNVTTQYGILQQYINKIDKILLQLKTYGIRVSIQKDECFTEIREYLDKANIECNDLIKKSNYLIGIMESLHEQNIKDNPTFDTDPSGGLQFKLENFKEYKPNGRSILVTNLDNAISSLDKFISGDGSIIKLFTTN